MASNDSVTANGHSRGRTNPEATLSPDGPSGPSSPATSNDPFVSEREKRGSTLCSRDSYSLGSRESQDGESVLEHSGILHPFLRAVGQKPLEETLDYGVPEIVKPVSAYPHGYGRVAAKQACDPALLIFRKFAWLHNHVLLDLQDELQLLEEQLEKHLQWESTHGDKERLISRRADYKRSNSRQALIQEIKVKLDEYDEFLFHTQTVQEMERPTRRSQNYVYNILSDEDDIKHTERRWIQRSEDITAISRNAEDVWLNGYIEDMLNRFARPLLLYFFQTKEQEKRSAGLRGFYLVSPKRIGVLIRSIYTFLATVLLLLPICILVKLQPSKRSEVGIKGRDQVLTILFFTLLFSASLSIFTKAKRQEVFSATAAYAAVLAILLGNTAGGCGLSS